MDDGLYDEFGNYLGPEDEESEDDLEAQEQNVRHVVESVRSHDSAQGWNASAQDTSMAMATVDGAFFFELCVW